MKNVVCFFLLLLVSGFFLTNHVCGQPPVSKYGEVTMNDLKAIPDLNDTTAEAIILFDKGHFNGNQITFTRHLRIKVLKGSGTRWGNWVINTPSKSNFKAVVFNLENGLLVKSPLERSSVFEEQLIDDYYVYKIFAPNVKVGSVIDIYYYHPGIPFEWRFQERIPVLYSEIILEGSPHLAYSKTQYGFEPVHQVSQTKWVASDMPAFKMEPYLRDYSNYITKFHLQVTSISLQARRVYFNYEFSTSWKVINNFLLNHPRFGDVLTYSSFLNEAAKEIKAKEANVEERISLAYDYIRNNIKWNGYSSVFATENASMNFKKNHSGNSADVNLCLVALLNKVGVEAKPVVLSTRENGIMFPMQPSINKLNYVIAQASHGNFKMLIDATSDKLIPGILPDRCLNGSGLIVEQDKENWTDLNTEHIKRKKQYITININDDGTAKATVSQHFDQYGYLEWLQSNETDAEEQKYVAALKKKHPNLKINNYKVEQKDPGNLSVDEMMEVDLSDYVLDLDDELLFSPFIFSDHRENIFKAEERRYPVDLTYPSEFSTTIVINIPENYKVKAVPQPIMLTTTDRSAVLRILSGVQASQVQFQMNFRISKALFTEEEYPELRFFFTQMIKKLDESVQLTRNN